MAEKSADRFDLDGAVLDRHGRAIEEEDITPTRRKPKRAAAFLMIPSQIMARIEACDLLTPGAWPALCALQWLEFRAEKKGQPIKLTNAAPRMLGMSRKLKYQALDELRARGFILPYVKSARASPLVRLNMKLQK